MSSISPPPTATSQATTNENTTQQQQNDSISRSEPVVTRGAIVFDQSNRRICMNLLSSLDEPNHLNIRDADCSSSSSSSGIVSSSTVGREYFDEDGSNNFGEYLNTDQRETVTSEFSSDCLAYRCPWATPPTATSESSKLQIGGTSNFQNNEGNEVTRFLR